MRGPPHEDPWPPVPLHGPWIARSAAAARVSASVPRSPAPLLAPRPQGRPAHNDTDYAGGSRSWQREIDPCRDPRLPTPHGPDDGALAGRPCYPGPPGCAPPGGGRAAVVQYSPRGRHEVIDRESHKGQARLETDHIALDLVHRDELPYRWPRSPTASLHISRPGGRGAARRGWTRHVPASMAPDRRPG